MMRKFLSIVVMIHVLAASAALAQQTKVIKDSAEYNAYILALKRTVPAQKASAMEAFLKRYPNSVVKVDALEQAMQAYQQLGSQNDVESTARRILAIDKENVRALAVVVFLERVNVTQAGDDAAVAQLRADSERGLTALPKWAKPAELKDAEFTSLKTQMTGIFAGAAGFAALKAKDYPGAQKFYREAVALGPDDLQNVYQLSIAELEPSPPNPDGFWHIARAMHLADAAKNAPAVQSMERYGKAKYVRFHGGDDGWDAVVQQAAASAELPKDFAKQIKAAATPAEIAVQALRDNDPSTLSFSDMEFVLALRDASPANKDAAERVWQAIQARQANGTRIKIHVKVIAATATEVDVAVTDENRQANKADMHVVMAKPLAKPPAPGTYVDVTGQISEYTASPFKFAMTRGEI
jgi:tetratricopeptide (TPR) repeat protein